MRVIFSPGADGPALHVGAGSLSRPRALAAALGACTPWRPFGPLALTQPDKMLTTLPSKSTLLRQVLEHGDQELHSDQPPSTV